MNATYLQNFKALLPSWKFFDRVGVIPVFSFRVDAGSWSQWRPHYKRGLKTLFFNPEGNFTLAKVSLLERVLGELGALQIPEQYVNTVSYALLREWARDEVLKIGTAHTFQFKVSLCDQRIAECEFADVLISIEHEV